MEKTLFRAEWQEQVDDWIIEYKSCILKQPIRNWGKGTFIHIIAIDIYNGKMKFFDENNNLMDEINVKLEVI